MTPGKRPDARLHLAITIVYDYGQTVKTKTS